MIADDEAHTGRPSKRAPHRGFGATIANNMSAFGYSLLATGSFGVIAHFHGSPAIWEALLFTTGAIAPFVVAEMLLTRLFLRKADDEPQPVVALGTTFSFLSVGLSVAAADLVATLIGSALAWGVGGLVATTTYILCSGGEMAAAERITRWRRGG